MSYVFYSLISTIRFSVVLGKIRELSVGDLSLIWVMLFFVLDLCLNFVIVGHLIFNCFRA